MARLKNLLSSLFNKSIASPSIGVSASVQVELPEALQGV